MARHRSARVTALVLGVAALACGDAGTSPQASCIAVVNVGGVIFGSLDAMPVPTESVSGEPYLIVTGNTGCLDQGEAVRALAPGESNFLAVGTTLHAIEAFEPTERLAVYYELIGEWRALEPLTLTQGSF